jgi:pimeloyl-ACP methyl ester carboxylesterase
VDRLAQNRVVILLNNRGVGASTGAVPDNVTHMARDALLFIDALGLNQVDVLGFSLGGFVAQELTLMRPRLVRRLVLAGTAPQGGSDAQLAAITAWGIPDASRLNRLAGITQPTFIAVGDNDTMMHTKNSHLLAEHLPNAHLRVYPDANHGFLDQYPELFADPVRAFLDG